LLEIFSSLESILIIAFVLAEGDMIFVFAEGDILLVLAEGDILLVFAEGDILLVFAEGDILLVLAEGDILLVLAEGDMIFLFPRPEGLSNIRLTGKGDLARIVRQEQSDQAQSVTNAFVRLKRLFDLFFLIN